MRILVTASHAPFLHGGGERHVDNLCAALRTCGHEVALLRVPFKFAPEADIERAMAFCDGYDLASPNGQQVDRLISLQFPGYGMHHPQHVVWLMHQHRAVYELFDPREATPALKRLRENIVAYDGRALSRTSRTFANSRRVAERLRQHNGLEATPLYHPPPGAELLHCGESWNYVFYPSRLESLKRQDLLIEAARHLTSGVKVLIGGEGPQRDRYQRLIERHDLGDRVRLMGAFSEAERIALYAHASRSCSALRRGSRLRDAGGDVRRQAGGDLPGFRRTVGVRRHGETGEVVDPSPQALADAIDRLVHSPARPRDGQAGRERAWRWGFPGRGGRHPLRLRPGQCRSAARRLALSGLRPREHPARDRRAVPRLAAGHGLGVDQAAGDDLRLHPGLLAGDAEPPAGRDRPLGYGVFLCAGCCSWGDVHRDHAAPGGVCRATAIC